MRFIRTVCIVQLLALVMTAQGAAQDTALLLFDGETGTSFAGCLNCSRYDDASVCNPYGDFGSRYSDESIWNPYGPFGSRYEENSPWNPYGVGLRIVDQQGGFYGMFTSGLSNRSGIGFITSLVEANEAMEDLEALRDLFCEQ